MPLKRYTSERTPISIGRCEEIMFIGNLKEALEKGIVTKKEIIAVMKMTGYTKEQIEQEFERFCAPAGADAYGRGGILGETDW